MMRALRLAGLFMSLGCLSGCSQLQDALDAVTAKNKANYDAPGPKAAQTQVQAPAQPQQSTEEQKKAQQDQELRDLEHRFMSDLWKGEVKIDLDELGRYVITRFTDQDFDRSSRPWYWNRKDMAVYWAAAYGYGFSQDCTQMAAGGVVCTWSRQRDVSGYVAACRKYTTDPENCALRNSHFDGIAPEKIGKVVFKLYLKRTRNEEHDEYGHKTQNAGTRLKEIQECVLLPGNANKFQWDNLHVADDNVPRAVEREAAKTVSCRKVKSGWGEWQ